MVKAALLEQDKALQKARDAVAAQTIAIEKETTLASVQAQLQ
jgi:hypothetical protein